MNDNPYAPPNAHVEDIRPEQPGVPVFFAVSLLKLTIMSVCTLGLYEAYWFYRNWKIVRERERSEIFPIWRAIFGVLFCYFLFKRVREAGEQHGIDPVPPAGILAFVWIILTVTWQLPDWYSLLSFASVFVLWPVQACVNAINAVAVPNHDSNWQLSGWNWLGIAAGGLFVLLAATGALEPKAVTVDLPVSQPG